MLKCREDGSLCRGTYGARSKTFDGADDVGGWVRSQAGGSGEAGPGGGGGEDPGGG